jgi:hypothetical protein
MHEPYTTSIYQYLSYLVSKSAAAVIDQRFKVNSAKYPQGRQVYFDVWCWMSAKRLQGLQSGIQHEVLKKPCRSGV